jgi:hypothetical protein
MLPATMPSVLKVPVKELYEQYARFHAGELRYDQVWDAVWIDEAAFAHAAQRAGMIGIVNTLEAIINRVVPVSPPS